MEKIRDSISKELPPLRLYMDEIIELHQFISSEAEEVSIQAEGYNLKSPDELKDLPVDHIHNLEIKSKKPYIWVTLKHFSGEIYIGGGDIKAEGIVSRIEEILMRGRANVYFVPLNLWSGLLFPWIPLGIGMVLKNKILISISIALAGGFSILTAIDYQFKIKQYTTILPIKRKEEASFWSRNKDKILLLIVGAIAGAIAGIVIPKIAEWILILIR